MTDISITRAHNLQKSQVRDRVEELVNKLVAKYGGRYNWNGDKAEYRFSGIEADLGFDDRQLQVEVRLGFLMKTFKSIIEQEIEDYMKRHGLN